MISIFVNKDKGVEVRRTADFKSYLPIGAEISSGVQLTDPADPRNWLKVVGVRPSFKVDEVTYLVVPST